jgi:purine-binding chemotaxis protein CheW
MKNEASQTNKASHYSNDHQAELMDTEQYLTFILNGQEYAIDILKIQGIQGWGNYTSLPNTPAHILGVINLRGSIVPIIDLRIRFAMPSVEYNDLTVVIVVKVEHGDSEKMVGLVVDEVSEVYNIDPNSLNMPPDFGADVDTAYVKGLALVKEKLVIAIDIEKLIGESVLTQLNVDVAI